MTPHIRSHVLFWAGLCVLLGLTATVSAQDATPASQTIEATVAIDAGNTFEPISPFIYGQFIEHLGRCIYGGIWAEMLEDRKFHFPVPAEGDIWRLTRAQARVLAASPWKVIGPKDSVKMVKQDAFVGDHSPQITAPGGTRVGIYQEELGVVGGKRYTGYIYLAGDGKAGPVTVSLIWGDADADRDTVAIKKLRSKYTKVPLKFTVGKNTDNARLEIVATGEGTLTIGCVSLMPADNVEGFRADTLELLRQLDAPLYRWPGGNFVSGYDWRDGIGDRDRRPTRTNPAWTGIETNDMGMHEFVRFCQLVDAEPMITVNTGFGDAYSAAAQVEYANGARTTLMGRLRSDNGQRAPLDVKWWCVGNEMWGNWQLGYMSLNHYVLKHNWVEQMMREVDPSIKTVASGDLGDAGPRSWSRGMLTRCADHMDLISEHFYTQSRDDIAEHVQQVPNQIRRKADGHRTLRKELPSLKGKDIRIAMTEWNYWYGPHVFGELGTRYFLKDALGIAAGLHEYFRNTDIIWMANYAQTVNVIGCIKTTKTTADFDSTGLPLMLYRKQFGTVPVAVKHEAAPLDVSAALTADGKTLTIGIVNPTRDTYRLKLDLANVAAAGAAQTWIIAGDDPMAYNEPGEPRNVDIEGAAPTDLTGAIAVRPLSITLLRAPIE
ncbi:MAG: alpha-N-arabinofuranosidase [Planctomycetes bacterium]|nr:alpha-N-arabinofuranosidase [Planctomycetota bacterium]